jgi:hypothetical protein
MATLFLRTDKIQHVIDEAIQLLEDDTKHADYENLVSHQSNEQSIPYPIVKKAVQVLNSHNKDCFFHEVIKGSDICFAPDKQKPRNAKLEARLVKLRKLHSDMEYADSVKNITTRTRAEAKRDPFSSYKGQMGIGLDLIVTMFTLFVLFYTLASYHVPGKENYGYHLVCGLVGIVCGLIIDAILLIIRQDHNDKMIKRKHESRSKSTSSLKGRTNYKGESVTRFLSERDKLAVQDAKQEEQTPTGVPFKL